MSCFASRLSHVYVWEGGGVARLSGVTTRTVAGAHGLLKLDDFRDKIRPDDGHYVHTRLVCLENTHNRGGGRVLPIEDVAAIFELGAKHGLAMHLDGARLMNAVVASGIAGRRVVPAFRHHLDLLLEGAGRTGRLGARRHGGYDSQGTPAPKGFRRRDASGRDHRRRGAARARPSRRPTRRGPRKRPAHRPRRDGDEGPSPRIGTRSRRTWSGSTVDPELGNGPRGRGDGSAPRACSSPPWVHRCCGHAHIWTSSRTQAEEAADKIRALGRVSVGV